MSSQLESLRHDTESLPDSSDKQAMLAALAELEDPDRLYRAYLAAEKEGEKANLARNRHEGRARIFLFLIALGIGYFPVRGMAEGRIKNIFTNIDYFSAAEHPYAYLDTEPYLFFFLISFYALCSLSFLLGSTGITYLGRHSPRPMTRAEFDRLTGEL